jgi:hypothetical protein
VAAKEKPKGFLKSAFNFMTLGVLGGDTKPKPEPAKTQKVQVISEKP